MILPVEILKKVKLLEITTRKLVNNLFAGEYHTAFKGQGMTFSEFREYVPGDDIRTIYWPLTARTGKTYIKKFNEERELTLMLIVDISGSLDFGSNECLKGEVVTNLAALLAFSALKNNDQVGLLLFSDKVEHFVPPRKGRGHIHRILRDLYYHKPSNRGTRITVALDYLQGILKKHAAIFLFSDFIDEGFEVSLKQLSKKHDAVAVVVNDQLELNLPNIGIVDFHDAETGEVVTVDTSSVSFRERYSQWVQERQQLRDGQLRRAQIDKFEVLVGQDYAQALSNFFQKRRRR